MCIFKYKSEILRTVRKTKKKKGIKNKQQEKMIENK